MPIYNNNADVTTPEPTYTRMLPLWTKVSDFVEGEAAVKRKRETYLIPFSSSMDPELYNHYLQYAQLPGITSAMYDTTVGAIVGDNYTLEANGFEDLLETISDDGLPINQTIYDTVRNDITGRAGIFVDYPSVTDTLTVAQREAQNNQARISVFSAEQIIEARYETLNGVRKLVRARLRMTDMVADGEFGVAERDVVIVLRLGQVFDEEGEPLLGGRIMYSMQRYVKSPDSAEFVPEGLIIPELNGVPLDFIPLWLTNKDNVSPVLVPIADLEKHAYNTITQTNFSFARANTPTIVLTNVSDPDEALAAGWGGAWAIEGDGASVQLLSLPTDIITNYASVIGQQRAMLAAQGANFIADAGRQAESAEALEIKNGGYFNKVKFRAQSQSMSIQEAIRFALFWTTGRDTSQVTFQLNPSFTPMQSLVDELREVVNAYNSGVARKQDVFNLLQKTGVIPQDETFEDWMGELEEIPEPQPLAFGTAPIEELTNGNQ